MKESCIEKHLYERRYQTATGEWSRVYYVRLKASSSRGTCTFHDER